MPGWYCYKCKRLLDKDNLNEKKDGFFCPNCKEITSLELKDYKRLGLKLPSESTSPASE